MTRRIRNTIIDGTTGKVLTGTDVSTASSNYVIAALVPKQVSIEIKSPGSVVQVVTATKAWKPSSNGIITRVYAVLRTSSGPGADASPLGQPLLFRLRQQKVNGSSTLYNYTISSGSHTSTNNISLSVLSTDNIYIDVLQVGSTRPGQGLIVYIEYYIG